MGAPASTTNVASWRPSATPSQGDVVLAFPRSHRRNRAGPTLSAEDGRRLEILRDLARRSQLVRRPACLIGCDAGMRANIDAGEHCAAEQFLALVAIADRRVTFYPPGAAGASLDEWWLLRIFNALSGADVQTASELIAFRVERRRRRRVLDAAAPIVFYLETIAAAAG